MCPRCRCRCWFCCCCCCCTMHSNPPPFHFDCLSRPLPCLLSLFRLVRSHLMPPIWWTSLFLTVSHSPLSHLLPTSSPPSASLPLSTCFSSTHHLDHQHRATSFFCVAGASRSSPHPPWTPSLAVRLSRYTHIPSLQHLGRPGIISSTSPHLGLDLPACASSRPSTRPTPFALVPAHFPGSATSRSSSLITERYYLFFPPANISPLLSSAPGIHLIDVARRFLQD